MIIRAVASGPMGTGHCSIWGGRSSAVSVAWSVAPRHTSVSLLQVPSRGHWLASQVLLQDMSISRLYSLVVVLFRLDNLKAKLPVEVDRRLVADLDVTVERVRLGQPRY